MKVVAIASGGLDSTVVAAKAVAEGHEVTLLGFDYGQKHRRELEALEEIGEAFDVPVIYADMSGLQALLPSALTDPSQSVPHGRYDDDNMASTVVPNRNAIFISVACGVAAGIGAEAVYIGVHGGDHYIYADCRPEFIYAVSEAMELSVGVRVEAPYLHADKTFIVAEGAKLGAPLGSTWSCYEGGTVHCGECGTCVERREAFSRAGVEDPTVYATTVSS